MHGIPSILKRKWVSKSIVCSLLTNCSDLSVFGSYWETCNFMVCEHTCSCGHKMDEILWQTLGAFDLVHSSHKWILAILLCGEHSTTMQIWIDSKLWFCRRQDSKSTSGVLCIFGSHTFVPISWMCKKQTSVSQFNRSWNHFSRCKFTHGRYSRSHSLGFGDWSISFRTEHNRTDGPKREPRWNPSAVVEPNMHNTIHIPHTSVIHTNRDHIPPNFTHSYPNAMLYVFEAVIKMMIKGRSPTMRHVSRTHRVALDWLIDRINLDPKIQIRYIDTKNQIRELHTWWVAQSSAFVQYHRFQLNLLHQEFQLDKLHQNDGEKDAGAKRRRKSCVQVATCSDESIFVHSDKFLHRIQPDCI